MCGHAVPALSVRGPLRDCWRPCDHSAPLEVEQLADAYRLRPLLAGSGRWGRGLGMFIAGREGHLPTQSGPEGGFFNRTFLAPPASPTRPPRGALSAANGASAARVHESRRAAVSIGSAQLAFTQTGKSVASDEPFQISISSPIACIFCTASSLAIWPANR